MKNLTLLLVLFGLTVYLNAQPFGEAAANFRIIKQEYENGSGEIASTGFKYDSNGKLIKAFWTLENKSRNSVNWYEHDSEGQLISAYREFSDGLTSFEVFTYDSLDNKISEHFYRSDSITGYASYRYKGNRLEQAEFKNYKGWLSGTLIFSYNEQKKKESALLVHGDKILCQISYEYDEDNNLIKQYWDFQGQWYQSFKHYYEKTDQHKNYYSSPFLTNKGNYRISKEEYTFNDEVGGPSFYYYNEAGLLYKKVFMRSDSFSTTTFYKYDAERRLKVSKRNYSDGRTARFTYVYDENDRLVLRTYFTGDTLAGFESYLYNQEGDLMKAYIRNFDNWLTGTIDFDHDEPGTITKGTFKGENGFDALISFNYNDAGLPVEIIWEFTFGKFQRYSFEYELRDSN